MQTGQILKFGGQNRTSLASSCEIRIFFFFFQRMSQKKVMSVLWQEWQVWGIITETWKVCVSTFGHLRRINPHCAAAGLMSTDSPASNEKRAIATVFHQPSAPSVQHPIMPWTRGMSNWTAAGILSHINVGVTELAKESAKMSSSHVQSWKHYSN